MSDRVFIYTLTHVGWESKNSPVLLALPFLEITQAPGNNLTSSQGEILLGETGHNMLFSGQKDQDAKTFIYVYFNTQLGVWLVSRLEKDIKFFLYDLKKIFLTNIVIEWNSVKRLECVQTNMVSRLKLRKIAFLCLLSSGTGYLQNWVVIELLTARHVRKLLLHTYLFRFSLSLPLRNFCWLPPLLGNHVVALIHQRNRFLLDY